MPQELRTLRARAELKGGHSGIDIHRNRLNALQALAQLLHARRRGGAGTADAELRLVALDGGSKRNAIRAAKQSRRWR
ncbi:MAG: hypothetical protein U1F06_10680 [Steroidobacteraceae bacterium]